MKYILITGGILSGIGKGVISSSIGAILREMGYNVTAIKIDPYLNLDAGTMSPYEHGEVFVLDDGGEADLDLGNYERFIGLNLGRRNNITTGKVYNKVITKERKGDYLGKTVQVVPHITDCIQDWIASVAAISTMEGHDETPDFCVIELGGTVGDIESMPFIEALRQFQYRPDVGADHFMNVHVSLVPVMGSVGEQKTKPLQSSVRSVRMLGLSPDVVMCRSSQVLDDDVRAKITQMTGVPSRAVLGVHDVSNIYRVPSLLEKQGFCDILCRHFHLPASPALDVFHGIADRVDDIRMLNLSELRIAVVGKYTGLSDSYLSIIKALQHSAYRAGRELKIDWIESVDLEGHDASSDTPAWSSLRRAHGILVPGGFGDRGVEGKIAATQYARTNKVPFLGICLGMQVAAIEYARNVMGVADAASEEFEPRAEHKVVVFMPEIDRDTMGGNMRLGRRLTRLVTDDCFAYEMYGRKREFYERHRHRYEINPEYIPRFNEAGLRLVGFGDDGTRTQVVELPTEVHPYFVAVQFHPEFKSRPNAPSPPFLGLVRAAAGLEPVAALSASV